MQIQEQTTEIIEATEYNPISTSNETNFVFPSEATAKFGPILDSNSRAPRLFEYCARATFAERFPRLTCFAISFGLLASALVMEVECLKGSGYFWR